MTIGLDRLRAVLPNAVSRETENRLATFKALFDDWSKRINLVASSTADDFWTRHIADSAQLLRIKPHARHWIDLGSGGGFPGLVIAILLADLSDRHIDLVESNRKKAAFLQTVRTACTLNARVHADRVERVLPGLSTPDVITARALAPLPELLAMIAPTIGNDTVALFHKGRGYDEEVARSRAQWDIDLIKHPSLVAADSVVLEISRLRRISTD